MRSSNVAILAAPGFGAASGYSLPMVAQCDK